MPAIRIIDDHIELASIGTNTHAQIDTHIAAADDYVKRDGSLALAADWDIGDTRKILADEIRARDAAGLKLYDDAGNGIFVKDGGDVGIGTDAPVANLDIGGYGAPTVVTPTAFLLGLYANCNETSGMEIKNPNTGTRADTRIAVVDGLGDYMAFSMPGQNHSATLFGSLRNTTSYLFTAGAGRNLTIGTVPNKDLIFGTNNSERIRILGNGNVGINTISPTTKLDVNSDIFRLRTAKTPATAGAAGNQGDICWDAGFIYVCTATNSWERAAIAAW